MLSRMLALHPAPGAAEVMLGYRSLLEAFDCDLQPLVLIRTVGYLECVLDHIVLCALGIYRRVIPPRLSTFLDRKNEIIFRVKFAKILFHGAESQRARRGRVHGGFLLDAGIAGIVSLVHTTIARHERENSVLWSSRWRGRVSSSPLVSFLDCTTARNPANV